MISILAHKGSSKDRPENTMAAFKRAYELGADGLELDVHMLFDETIIVHHDSKLGRCENAEGNIYSHTKETIKSFSIGDKFAEEYKNEVIPTLNEVLEFLKENDMFLNVEVKADSCFMSNISDNLITLLDKFNMIDRCIISSFNHYILKQIKDKYPKYKVGILYSNSYNLDVVEYCVANNFDAIHPHFKDIDKMIVDKCHENGILVNAWTVDIPEDLQKMLEYDVDTVITNDILTAQTILK